MSAIYKEDSRTLKYYIFKRNIKSFYYLQWVWSWIWKIFKKEESIEILKSRGLINNIE